MGRFTYTAIGLPSPPGFRTPESATVLRTRTLRALDEIDSVDSMYLGSVSGALTVNSAVLGASTLPAASTDQNSTE